MSRLSDNGSLSVSHFAYVVSLFRQYRNLKYITIFQIKDISNLLRDGDLAIGKHLYWYGVGVHVGIICYFMFINFAIGNFK